MLKANLAALREKIHAKNLPVFVMIDSSSPISFYERDAEFIWDDGNECVTVLGYNKISPTLTADFPATIHRVDYSNIVTIGADLTRASIPEIVDWLTTNTADRARIKKRFTDLYKDESFIGSEKELKEKNLNASINMSKAISIDEHNVGKTTLINILTVDTTAVPAVGQSFCTIKTNENCRVFNPVWTGNDDPTDTTFHAGRTYKVSIEIFPISTVGFARNVTIAPAASASASGFTVTSSSVNAWLEFTFPAAE